MFGQFFLLHFLPLSVFFSSWRCQRVPRKTEKVGRQRNSRYKMRNVVGVMCQHEIVQLFDYLSLLTLRQVGELEDHNKAS